MLQVSSRPQVSSKLREDLLSLARNLELKKRWFVLVVLIVCSVAFGAQASRQFFWFDELFTVHLAALPSASVLWTALSKGADLVPPLYHLITHTCVALFGPGHLSVRLPSIAGFALMCFCLFWFVSRRSPAIYAAVAMLLPFLTGAERYATEARPYGMVMGFCALALLCWQASTENSRRKAALAGLAISLAVAVSLHYYAVLMVAALGSGELVRTIRTKRADAGIWCAFIAGVLPLPFHLPFIRLSQPYLHNSWSAPTLPALIAAYWELAGPVILVIAGAALLVIVLKKVNVEPQPGWMVAPEHELVAASVLIALPLIVFLVAHVATGVFVLRYALPAILGFALLTSFLLRAADSKAPILGTICFLLLSAAFLFTKLQPLLALTIPADRPPIPEVMTDTASLPIVVDSPFRFLELTYYAPPELRRRLYYLAEPTEARNRVGSNAPDSGLLALGPWAPIQVEKSQAFLATHKEFLLYWQPDAFGWILRKLSSAKAKIEVRSHQGSEFLFAVTQE